MSKKTILITGANRGIGLGLVEKFAAGGHTVLAGHRTMSDLGPLEKFRAQYPDLIYPVAVDVAEEESVAALARHLVGEKRAIHLLVNNAAVFPESGSGALSSIELESLHTAMEVNVVGPLRVTRALLPCLRRAAETGEGAAVAYISSGAGSLSREAGKGHYAYGISKAALNKAVRILARDAEVEGIPQVLYTPGWVKTDMGGAEAELSLEECVEPLSRSLLALGSADNGQWYDRHGKTTEFAW